MLLGELALVGVIKRFQEKSQLDGRGFAQQAG